jgi:sec-independent protein translocase protein TatB
MFDFSSGELLLIALAVLIFIKPKDLPVVLRTVGQWTGKIRRMAGEFQDQFREAMREAEVSDLKKDIDEATGNLGAGLDPFKEADAWKPSETPAEHATPPAADAPPAPPAEAVVHEPAAVAAEAAPSSPASSSAEPSAPAPAAETAAPPSKPPPASGDRAA